MFGKNTGPSWRNIRLIAELRRYIEDNKPRPVTDQAPRPSGIKYSLPTDGDYESFEQPSWNNPDNITNFTEYLIQNKISYDESNIRDLYLEWELKNGLRKSFGSEVNKMVDQMFPKPSMFYNAVGMDKRTFHKIKTDYGYKPSKKTAYQCCIGLCLDVNAAEKLLKLAGYALSPSEPMDLIIRFCLEKHIWDIDTINFLLSSFDLEDLDE